MILLIRRNVFSVNVITHPNIPPRRLLSKRMIWKVVNNGLQEYAAPNAGKICWVLLKMRNGMSNEER
jgi:hypothetical protein